MNTSLELHELNLVSSSKLKLRATARLAEGTEAAIFDACVLFHEAARLERRAVEALPVCPPETQLLGSIEECGCLLDGRDPDGGARVWGRILTEADALPSAVAESMLSRLRPRYDQEIRAFKRSLGQHPVLHQIVQTGIVVPTSTSEQRVALEAVREVSASFPGVPWVWLAMSLLAEALGETRLAWEASARAVQLVPENSSYHALSLVLAAQALRPAEADRQLTQTYAALSHAEAEVCLLYAFGEIALASRSPATRNERWKRALTAVNAGFPKARSEWMTKTLTGVRLFLEAALAKRKTDPDLLYRAGLGRLAATSGHKSPIDALRAEATARVRAMASTDAAA